MKFICLLNYYQQIIFYIMDHPNSSELRLQNDELDYCPRQRSQYKLPQSVIMRIRFTKSMEISKLKYEENAKPQETTMVCPICTINVQKQQLQSVSNCNHLFCISCLHQYLIYKINLHEKVECPHEGCLQKLDTTKQLFKGLPNEVSERYKKNEKYMNLKNTQRLCPQEKCTGILDISNPNKNPNCQQCKKTFCKTCFFPQHNGPCDPYQLNFFEENLHYRQCSKCKAVIQKISGCNHITCKCGYQFCYVCRQAWGSRTHFHEEDQLQRQTVNQNRRNIKIFGCVVGIFALQLILAGIIAGVVVIMS